MQRETPKYHSGNSEKRGNGKGYTEMTEESRMRVRERARSYEIERERETEAEKRRQIGREIEI